MSTGQSKPVPNEHQKQLIMKAAKAAGLTYNWSAEHGFMLHGAVSAWNPLEDDGDAMLIANHLIMSINLDHNGARAWIGEDEADGGGEGSPYRALRFAIVRLAAKLGERCS